MAAATHTCQGRQQSRDSCRVDGALGLQPGHWAEQYSPAGPSWTSAFSAGAPQLALQLCCCPESRRATPRPPWPRARPPLLGPWDSQSDHAPSRSRKSSVRMTHSRSLARALRPPSSGNHHATPPTWSCLSTGPLPSGPLSATALRPKPGGNHTARSWSVFGPRRCPPARVLALMVPLGPARARCPLRSWLRVHHTPLWPRLRHLPHWGTPGLHRWEPLVRHATTLRPAIPQRWRRGSAVHAAPRLWTQAHAGLQVVPPPSPSVPPLPPVRVCTALPSSERRF